jgi:hypothetical protein
MLPYALHNSSLCTISDLIRGIGTSSKTFCLAALTRDVLYRNLQTKKCNQIGLLELSILDDSTHCAFKYFIWGQVAQDRLKYSIASGSVLVIIQPAVTMDKYGREVLSGELVAYTALGLMQLEWLMPSAEQQRLQDRSDHLLAWALQDAEWRLLRENAAMPVSKRSLEQVSRLCTARLVNLHVQLLLKQPQGDLPSQDNTYVEVDFLDSTGCAAKLMVLNSTLHGRERAPLCATAHRRHELDCLLLLVLKKTQSSSVAAELRAVAVAYAYHSSIK